MGCYHFKDVNVINYGPQNTPLGDCKGFGLEGGQLLLADFITELSVSSGGFSIQGMSRMSSSVNKKDSESASHPNHAGWIATCQEYKNKNLWIKTQFQRLFDQEELLFTFFVKCKQCIVNEDKIIRRRSLNRYGGRAEKIEFKGNKSSVFLLAGQNHEEMHVIPLGGGGNFWGADFLVAYQLKADTQHFAWQLNPS